MINRLDKINELVKQEVGKIMLKEIDIPNNVLVTITKSKTEPNLRKATIYFTTLPQGMSPTVLRELELNIYDIQKALNRKLHMKPVPRIEFKTDKQAQAEQKIFEILGDDKTK